MNFFQHGDVLVIPSEIPKGVERVKTNVLQEGEMTGHAHRLYGDGFEVFEDRTQRPVQKYLRLVEPVDLRHEEHHEIKLPKGDYKIGIVREYDHFSEEARQVAD